LTAKDGPVDEPVWIGIDVGTQSVRAQAVTAGGDVVGNGSAPLESTRAAGGRHEQDPELWWHALGVAAHRATSGLRPELIRAAALCATSGTILLTDDRNRALTDALMYDDARAETEAALVQETGAEIWHKLGHTMQRSWALPKVLWLLHSGTVETRTARVAHQSDHLAGRLVGHRVAADSSHALKTGYDSVEGRWPEEVIDRLEVPVSALPEVVVPGALLGRVDASGAEHTGLPEGLPVVAGMTDGCAAQIAAGALLPGDWNSVLGTTLVLKGVTEGLLRDPSGVMYSHRHPDGGWMPGGASSVGAGALTDRFPRHDLGALDAAAIDHEHVKGVAYPLSGKGERFPFLRPDAEAFETGVFTGKVDRYAALLHGVAYIERLCLEHVARLGAPVRTVSLTGGATRSRYWSQIRADVLRMPLRVPSHTEPSFGMAVLAAARDPNTPSSSVAEAARRMVRVREVVEPRDETADLFESGYRRMVAELDRRGYLTPPSDERQNL